jgi:hypothetical protein
MPEVNMIQAMPDTRGNARFWYRTPAAKAMAPKPPPPGATPKQLGWRSFQYTVPTYATCVRRLAELPDGRIFGTSGNYLGNFVYEPATGIIKDLGRLGLSHYSTAVVGKYVYMSGYPNAGLYIYDTTKPWTANSILGDWTFLSESDPRSNPRLFGYMSTVCGAHKMYGAAVGADGRIYFGGAWMRDGNAGGFAWYDPATQTMGGFWDLFSNHQIDFVTATTGGRYIVISTHRVDDPILGKPKPPQGSLFVFDTMSHTIVRQIDPILLAKGPGPIVGVTGTRVLGWGPYPDSTGAAVSGKSILYGVDVATGQIAFQKVLPVSLPVPVGSNQDEAFDFRLGPDGYVWTFTGSTVLRIDPSNANVQPTALLPTAGRMGFAGEMVYLGGTLDLRRFPRGMGNDISLQ